MSDNIKNKVLLVGSGNIGYDYVEILRGFKVDIDVIGRSYRSRKKFSNRTGLYVYDGIRNYMMNSLKKNGFQLLYIEPNWLFIYWNKTGKKELTEKVLDLIAKTSVEIGHKTDANTMATLSKIFSEDLQKEKRFKNFVSS